MAASHFYRCASLVVILPALIQAPPTNGTRKESGRDATRQECPQSTRKPGAASKGPQRARRRQGEGIASLLLSSPSALSSRKPRNIIHPNSSEASFLSTIRFIAKRKVNFCARFSRIRLNLTKPRSHGKQPRCFFARPGSVARLLQSGSQDGISANTAKSERRWPRRIGSLLESASRGLSRRRVTTICAASKKKRLDG